MAVAFIPTNKDGWASCSNFMKQSLIEYVKSQAYDVDERVRLYLDKLDKIEMSRYKPMDFKTPYFPNRTEQRKWEAEQIRRTRFGYGGIGGMMYQYTYFWKMKSKSGGLISPEFRRCNAEFFNLIESCLYGEHPDGLYEGNKGWGVILIGRRRWGKSYSLANAMYSTAIHNPYSEIGITSKTEEDMRKFMNDVLKTGYNNLPAFLRATSQSGNSQSRIEFSKTLTDKHGNKKKVGINSVIFGRSPEPTSFEGSGLRMVVYEEPGKWEPDQLKQNWSYTEPALAADDGITRMGVPILAGTAGDASKNGNDLKEFWYNADSYKLKRYFAAGWSGFMIDDEMGNENVVEAIKYILDEREKKKRQDSKRYYDFVVQYPLEVEECFIEVGESPFDIEILNNRMSHLMIEPAKIQRGFFRRIGDSVEFVPKEDGDVQITEHPKQGEIYAAGCDPTDGSEKANTGSNLSFFIGKAVQFGEDGSGRRAVMQYTAKPQDITIAYEQCAMACEYYSNDKGDCEVLVEKNRARMIAHFEMKGYQRYLAKKPKRTGRSEERSKVVQYGVHMDEALADEMIGEIDVDSRNYIENYDFMDLLSEMCNYSRDNKRKKGDRVDAWGLTLLNLRTAIKKRLLKKKTNADQFAKIGFRFENGKLTR